MRQQFSRYNGRKARERRDATLTRRAVLENGSEFIRVFNNRGLAVDYEVTGDGIPADTVVVAIDGLEIELSNAATEDAEEATLTFAAP